MRKKRRREITEEQLEVNRRASGHSSYALLRGGVRRRPRDCRRSMPTRAGRVLRTFLASPISMPEARRRTPTVFCNRPLRLLCIPIINHPSVHHNLSHCYHHIMPITTHTSEVQRYNLSRLNSVTRGTTSKNKGTRHRAYRVTAHTTSDSQPLAQL